MAVVVCYMGAGGIVRLFLKESEASLIKYSVRVFRIFILSFLIAGLNVVLGGYFTSVERAGFATMISLTRSLVALVIAESCCVVLALGLYRWYRKREK